MGTKCYKQVLIYLPIDWLDKATASSQSVVFSRYRGGSLGVSSKHRAHLLAKIVDLDNLCNILNIFTGGGYQPELYNNNFIFNAVV